jgi:hypothetical protein
MGVSMSRRLTGIVAFALAASFLLLSRLDRDFFLVHIYESLIYLAILGLLFKFQESWAYMLGIVAPGCWLLLTLAAQGFGGFMRQLGRPLQGSPPEDPAMFAGGIIAILCVVLIGLCAYGWWHLLRGKEKRLRTFLVGLGVVTAYYGVMILLVWRAVASVTG